MFFFNWLGQKTSSKREIKDLGYNNVTTKNLEKRADLLASSNTSWPELANSFCLFQGDEEMESTMTHAPRGKTEVGSSTGVEAEVVV